MKPLPLLLNTIYSDNVDLSITSFKNETIDFALDYGLGPYLNYCTQQSSPLPALLSSDLTANIITNSQIKALDEIIHKIAPKITELVLLKGIAICQNYYPKPHFRIMGDIDLLVSKNDQPQLERQLTTLGYHQKSNNDHDFYINHHHSMPFYNPKNGVWIEVHTHLLSKSSLAKHDDLFDLMNIKNNCVQMNKTKYPENILCFNPEFHFIYACVHWAEDFHISKGAVQLFDMVLLIKNHNNGLNWEKIIAWVNNTASASYIYLLLSYLNKRNILNIPRSHFKSLNLKHSNMAYINRSLMHYAIDSCLPEKRNHNPFINENTLIVIWSTLLQPSTSSKNLLALPWNVLFPPGNAQRYTLGVLKKRLNILLRYIIK